MPARRPPPPQGRACRCNRSRAAGPRPAAWPAPREGRTCCLRPRSRASTAAKATAARRAARAAAEAAEEERRKRKRGQRRGCGARRDEAQRAPARASARMRSAWRAESEAGVPLAGGARLRAFREGGTRTRGGPACTTRALPPAWRGAAWRTTARHGARRQRHRGCVACAAVLRIARLTPSLRSADARWRRNICRRCRRRTQRTRCSLWRPREVRELCARCPHWPRTALTPSSRSRAQPAAAAGGLAVSAAAPTARSRPEARARRAASRSLPRLGGALRSVSHTPRLQPFRLAARPHAAPAPHRARRQQRR